MLIPTDRFAALYFADDPIPAQFEVGAMLGSPTPGDRMPHPRRSSFVILNVHIILSDVIDLTDATIVQAPLDTNAHELTGDWKGYQIRNYRTPVSGPTGIAPTQELGLALSRTGIEGFRAISARVPWHKTVTVFTDNLRPRSSLTFSDSTGSIVHQIVR
jgi:hypothetical protein